VAAEQFVQINIPNKKKWVTVQNYSAQLAIFLKILQKSFGWGHCL